MAETLSSTERAINNFNSTQTVQEVIETYLFWRGEPSHIKSSTLQFAAAKAFTRLGETSRALQFTMLAEQDSMLERQEEVASRLEAVPARLSGVINQGLEQSSALIDSLRRTGDGFVGALNSSLLRDVSAFGQEAAAVMQQARNFMTHFQPTMEHLGRQVDGAAEKIKVAAPVIGAAAEKMEGATRKFGADVNQMDGAVKTMGIHVRGMNEAVGDMHRGRGGY